MQSSTTTNKVAFSERMITELKEFTVVAVYLWICFTAIAYLKASVLHAYGIAFAPFAFAAVKALICAKFVLIGRMLHVGERFKTPPLIWPVLYKSLAFVALLLVLNVFEEIVVGLMHDRAVADSIAEVAGGTLDQVIATSLVGLIILIPFFAFRALGEIVGEDNLIRVFFKASRR